MRWRALLFLDPVKSLANEGLEQLRPWYRPKVPCLSFHQRKPGSCHVAQRHDFFRDPYDLCFFLMGNGSDWVVARYFNCWIWVMLRKKVKVIWS